MEFVSNMPTIKNMQKTILLVYVIVWLAVVLELIVWVMQVGKL